MSEEATLLRNPLFRWGMPAAWTALIVALAFLVVEGQTVRLVMLVVVAVELLAVPQVLKRVTRNACALSGGTTKWLCAPRRHRVDAVSHDSGGLGVRSGG